MNGAPPHNPHHPPQALLDDVEEEVTITVEDVIAGLADADKARRLDMFRLLHEAVSGDTRKAVSVGRTDAAWHAIHQAALFRPSWDGDQPGVDDLICLEALSCVWAISAHEENKPLVVLYGGVDAVMLTFNKIKYEKGHPNWADFLQTMSAIIQNVCESHYDSGKKNDLHGVLVNKGVIEFLHFMVGERVFRRREDASNELECIKFLLCLTIGNLAYNRINRALLEEIGAFTFLRNCIRDTKILIKNSWRTLQPFVPLLGLVRDIRQGHNDPLWAVITLAILCLEQFSSKFGERARHFLWRTFALNDSPETLRVLLLSPVIRRTENEHLLEALLSLCKNMNLNVDQLTHNKDAVAAKEHMEKDLEDFGMLFNRREMFPDLVLVAPRHEPSSTTTLVGEVSAVRRPRNVTAAAHNDSSGGGDGEGLIYCHRAILAARCKVFAALFLRWEASDDEEGNDKESGEEKDNGSTASTAASGGGLELDDDEEEPKKRKKKEAKATKKKATGAKDLKKKRKRDGPPEHKHIRRKKDSQSNGKGDLQRLVVRDVDFDTMHKIVEFIYKGRVELDESCVVDVLRAADIYGLDPLKSKCEAFLGDSLDLDNIAKLLEIANIYSAWHLEKRCQEYIRFTYNGHFARVVESALFVDLFERMPHYRESLAEVCNVVSFVPSVTTSLVAPARNATAC